MPSFRIEYLTETTDERSVCHVIAPTADTLEKAGEAALAGFAPINRHCGATGFQIRDMRVEECTIVAIENVDAPTTET